MTDIEECMEALTENLKVNLPGNHVTRIESCEEISTQANPGNSRDGWDVPQSVIATAVQDLCIADDKSASLSADQGTDLSKVGLLTEG